jgi:conjugative transposon protein TcpC
MRGKKNRARPAAFAVDAMPDASARGAPAWPPGPPSREARASRAGAEAGRDQRTGTWPEAEAWPEADAWAEADARMARGHRPASDSRRWPGNDGWQPHRGPAGPAGPADPGLPRPRREYDAEFVSSGPGVAGFRPWGADYPADSQIAGASAALNPQSPAEWCPKGVRVRRNSLLRRRRRAGGGAMVRKATLDRGLRPDELAAAEEAGPGVTEPAELTEPTERPRQRRGAGGRWLIWTFRAVIWAVLLIIGFRGVVSIVSPGHFGDSAAKDTNAPATVTNNGFPTALAEAFALQFGNVYLNFSPAAAQQRASDLTPFIPVGSSPQFGWNGVGTQQLQAEQVASISVQNAHQAVITLLAQVSSGLIELGVPVYSSQDGLVVSAEPALLPGPERATPPSASSAANDAVAQSALSGQLPGFFRAYASGNQQTLGRYLAPGAVVNGLGGAVTYESISGIEVPAGGPTRRIAVSVTWQVVGQSTVKPRAKQGTSSSLAAGPANLQMSYEMTVVRQNGTWYVKAIGPSDLQPGGP